METQTKYSTTIVIKQFNDITSIYLSDDKSPIEKQMDIIKVVHPHLSEDEIYSMPLEEFEKIIKVLDFNSGRNIIHQRITLNGDVFELEGNSSSFDFTVRQMLSIQRAMKEDNSKYLHRMMAVLYTSDKFTLKEREELFLNELTVDRAIPFINILTKKYVTSDN